MSDEQLVRMLGRVPAARRQAFDQVKPAIHCEGIIASSECDELPAQNVELTERILSSSAIPALAKCLKAAGTARLKAAPTRDAKTKDKREEKRKSPATSNSLVQVPHSTNAPLLHSIGQCYA